METCTSRPRHAAGRSLQVLGLGTAFVMAVSSLGCGNGAVTSATEQAALLQKPSRRIPMDFQGFIVRSFVADAKGDRAGVCYRTSDNKHHFDLYDSAKATRLARITLTDIRVPQHIALSPGGTRVGLFELRKNAKRRYERAVSIWSLPAGKKLIDRWRPYSLPKTTKPRLASELRMTWMSFVAEDRLLTVTAGHRVDMWTLPEQKIVWTYKQKVPPLTSEATTSVSTWQPTTFALSPDRRTLAMYNGTAYEFLDVTTGKRRGQTSKYIAAAVAVSVNATSISPDGTKLASHVTVINRRSTLKPGEWVTVWNLNTGKQIAQYRHTARDKNSTHPRRLIALSWWGPQILVAWHGKDQAVLYEADTGNCLRDVQAILYGRNVYNSADGRFWYAVTKFANQEQAFCALDSPEPEFKRDPVPVEGGVLKRWWLYHDGIHTQPDARENRLRTRGRMVK